MQQHPIPQDITGYRFHIVGSMTLKQFGEVFLSVIIAVIIFNTNLIAPIKWLLIIISVIIGIVAAFLPIQERPLTHWVSTFIGIMYKPTKFFWKRVTVIPEYFLFKSEVLSVIMEPEIDLTPAKRQRIKEYLGSVPESSSFSTDFTQEETQRMKNILSSFDTVQTTARITATAKTTNEKPSLDIRVRGMRAQKKPEFAVVNSLEEVYLEPDSMFVKSPQDAKVFQEAKKTMLSTSQVAQDIEIPEEKEIKLVNETEKKDNEIIKTSTSDQSEKTFIKDQDLINNDLKLTKNANFNSSLPFPIKPTKPNKLVGMILSVNNDLLTDSIVEVQTLDGHIERAVKTNALGQFFITTPLRVGEYNVVIEKEGYVFQPLHININDTIIEPIEIRSEN